MMAGEWERLATVNQPSEAAPTGCLTRAGTLLIVLSIQPESPRPFETRQRGDDVDHPVAHRTATPVPFVLSFRL